MLTSPSSDTRTSAIQRPVWVAEAAYYRAARRGFQGGCPVEDWLAAEREIDDLLLSTANAASPRVALVFLDRRLSPDEGSGDAD